MLSCTLIIATLGRTTVLEDLFESLVGQGIPELECLVIDQNPDDRLDEILERWSGALEIRRLRSAPGLSRARNVGLQHARGDVIAFPDDDCWYTPSLLANVIGWFETHPMFNILTVGAKDRKGDWSGNRWFQDRCEIRPVNAFRTTFSSTIFFRRTRVLQMVPFDEAIGVGSGTRYSSGEETDYVLNLIKGGARGYFDRTWNIGHPKRDMLSGYSENGRATGYGYGMGYVLRKHSLLALGAAFVAYDMARSAAVAARGDLKASALCVHHARGIASGYVEGHAEGRHGSR